MERLGRAMDDEVVVMSVLVGLGSSSSSMLATLDSLLGAGVLPG